MISFIWKDIIEAATSLKDEVNLGAAEDKVLYDWDKRLTEFIGYCKYMKESAPDE